MKISKLGPISHFLSPVSCDSLVLQGLRCEWGAGVFNLVLSLSLSHTGHYIYIYIYIYITQHTNSRIAHTKCKVPQISCIQNITNTSQKQTFVLRWKHLCHNIIFWIYHIHTVFQNLKLFFHKLLCTFPYKIESNRQRDVEKITLNMNAKPFV